MFDEDILANFKHKNMLHCMEISHLVKATDKQKAKPNPVSTRKKQKKQFT